MYLGRSLRQKDTGSSSSGRQDLLNQNAIQQRLQPSCGECHFCSEKSCKIFMQLLQQHEALSLSLFMHTTIAIDIIHHFRTLLPPDCFWNLRDGSSFRVFERNLDLQQARESFMKIRFQRHRNPTFEYVCFGFQHHFISFQALTLSKKKSN